MSPDRGMRVGAAWAAAGWRQRGWPAMAALAIVLAALATAGVTSLSRYVPAYVAYRRSAPPALEQAVHAPAAARARTTAVIMPMVQTFWLQSRALGGYRDEVDVVLPPGYSAQRRLGYPVLYLLHGYPGAPAAFLTLCQVADTEATLVATGQMRPMILVVPTGSRSYLTDTEWANGIGRANAWETMVARDLVHAVDARYNTIRTGAARGIAGLSEGGYAALNIGLHHPREFGLLESWSGYMQAEAYRSIFGTSTKMVAYNSPASFVPSVAAAARADHMFVWFYSGTADPLVAQNRAFAAELASLRIAHYFYVHAGGHTWGLWRDQIESALMTASEHLTRASLASRELSLSLPPGSCQPGSAAIVPPCRPSEPNSSAGPNAMAAADVFLGF